MPSIADQIKQYNQMREQGYSPAPPMGNYAGYGQDLRGWYGQLPQDQQQQFATGMRSWLRGNNLGNDMWNNPQDYGDRWRGAMQRMSLDQWGRQLQGGMQQQEPEEKEPSPWDDFDPNPDREGQDTNGTDADLYQSFLNAGGGYNQNMRAGVVPKAGLPGYGMPVGQRGAMPIPEGSYRGLPTRNGIQPLGGRKMPPGLEGLAGGGQRGLPALNPQMQQMQNMKQMMLAKNPGAAPPQMPGLPGPQMPMRPAGLGAMTTGRGPAGDPAAYWTAERMRMAQGR